MPIVGGLKNTDNSKKEIHKWFILTVSGLVQQSQSVVQRPTGGSEAFIGGPQSQNF